MEAAVAGASARISQKIQTSKVLWTNSWMFFFFLHLFPPHHQYFLCWSVRHPLLENLVFFLGSSVSQQPGMNLGTACVHPPCCGLPMVCTGHRLEECCTVIPHSQLLTFLNLFALVAVGKSIFFFKRVNPISERWLKYLSSGLWHLHRDNLIGIYVGLQP